MKALFVAGGTGGHAYPALEVARECKNSGAQIYWIGKENSLEHEFSKKEGFTFESIKSSGFRNKSFIKKVLSVFYLITSFINSIFILLKIKPKFIFCFGGYLSLGPGFASFVLRVPLFIHEQNSVAGTANKLLAHLATEVFEGFPKSFKRNLENINFVGNPVRREITSFTNTNKAVTSTNKFKLLILGGSQGSTQLNLLVMDSLSEVKDTKNWEIVHQTGKADMEEINNFYKDLNINYKVESFIKNMGEVYSNCDLVISRAGAMTISELLVTHTPSILIPLPWATDDHQTSNARYLEGLGAATVLESDKKNISELASLLTRLSVNKEERLSMINSAKLANNQQVTKVILKKINESIKKNS
ncbi:MAG: UDP-N-acetylglucosamine--N-acetylmuramyl-(pentapeptide) pyrophosphoryl-undecaprenol N-acetylglucosamine transferase [Gammaproteobacteria bacterium]|nr:MAG: UDP-N-acetylglucosamine--N-acetylmuramyl-(pentapeptide) pyrophosphoryl-undecaprenol N-acetylglucosamine transferase [Gammaproteobacteria bacterium]